jgi:hypothetical protein
LKACISKMSKVIREPIPLRKQPRIRPPLRALRFTAGRGRKMA